MLVFRACALYFFFNLWTAAAAPSLAKSHPGSGNGIVPGATLPVRDLSTPTTSAVYYSVTDGNVFGDKTVQVRMPPAITNAAQLNGNSSSLDVYQGYIQQSLPFLLQQLNLTDAQVEFNVGDSVGFLSQGLFSALNISSFAEAGSLLLNQPCWPTGLCSIIQNWTDDLVCGFFAAGALPGYLLAEQAFRLLNPAVDVSPSSYSEEFYFRLVYGDLSRSSNVYFHRDANFPPGINTIAATFGQNIYVKPGYNQAIWAPHSLSNQSQTAFQASIRLLLHEMEHIKQEKEISFKPEIFGYRYLFEHCKSGFSYSENRYQKEAIAMEYVDDNLLIGKPAFQGFWRDTRLFYTIGYPTTNNTGRGLDYDTLPFDYGSVEIHDNGNCWRSYTTGELAALTKTGPKPWTKREPNGPACP